LQVEISVPGIICNMYSRKVSFRLVACTSCESNSKVSFSDVSLCMISSVTSIETSAILVCAELLTDRSMRFGEL
jgi:hypothetical protein